jgi:hypothetical protein
VALRAKARVVSSARLWREARVFRTFLRLSHFGIETMDNFINFKLLANPVNWVIIFLVLYLTALLANIVYTSAVTGNSPIPLPAI